MSSIMITAGRARLDLVRPNFAKIDIGRDIAERLAHIPRFGAHGQTHVATERQYTVAQHCVVGAKAIEKETGNTRLALGFLLHDAHEAFIGDITTPTKDALIELCGSAGGAFRAALAELKRRLDCEIYGRAGLSLSAQERWAVHLMDMRMLATEARQILGADPDREPHLFPAESIGAKPVNTDGALCPWRAQRCIGEWMALWDAWRPMRRAA